MSKKFVHLDGPSEVQIAWEDNDTEILVSNQTVTLNKLYGPTIFMSIRARPDLQRMEWVIERETGPQAEWKEWATIPAQLESDFSQDDAN